ncbi:hypothetical protein C5167_009469 [Papaver somniferum]|uniref:hAT-like transposase RNase-H fold domain-containing protein n=1 Tax=Papaver somniferum TaxID=3469 RepID=A0A4Y7K0J8_PAPSO|nr:hypothetical protein C5167_009469 [Papaver somniferum]
MASMTRILILCMATVFMCSLLLESTLAKGRTINYGDLDPDTPDAHCSPGKSCQNLKKPHVANPYHRGCEKAQRCRSTPSPPGEGEEEDDDIEIPSPKPSPNSDHGIRKPSPKGDHGSSLKLHDIIWTGGRAAKNPNPLFTNFLDTVSDLGMSVKMGVRQDVKTRWNSTYLMLQSCISYEKVFTHLRLVDPDYAESPNGKEWEQIKVVTKFLKVFYDLTTLFSGNKYPTSNFYFDGVCQIKVLLDQETTNDIEFIKNMAKKMQEKFAKYWKKLSPILAMAVVLDPRLKFEFVEFTLEKVYPVEREMKKEVDIIRKRMATLYKEYHTASTLRGSTTNETQNSGTVNGGNSGRNGRAASTDVEEVKDNDISEDVLAFEPANNNEAIHTGAS